MNFFEIIFNFALNNQFQGFKNKAMDIYHRNIEFAKNIIEASNFQFLPKHFQQNILNLFEVDNQNSALTLEMSVRLVNIFDFHKGQYRNFFTHPQFSFTHPDVKNCMMNIFKQYSQTQNIRQDFMASHKNFFNEPQFNETKIYSKPKNPNRFFNMPQLNSLQQVENFQKKMYRICKNSIPQIINSLRFPFKESSNVSLFANQRMSSFNDPYCLSPYSPPVTDLGFRYGNQFLSDFDHNNYFPEPSFMNYNKNIWEPFIESPKINRESIINNQRHQQAQTKNFDHSNNFSVAFKRYQSREGKLNSYKSGSIFQSLKQQEQSIKSSPRKLVKLDMQSQVISKQNKEQILACKCQNNPEKQQCIFCSFTRLQSSQEVIRALKILKLNSSSPNSYHYLIPSDILKENFSEQYDIELQCIDIKSKQISWPSEFIISVNNQQISGFEGNLPTQIIKLSELTNIKSSNERQIQIKIIRNSHPSLKLKQQILKNVEYAFGILLIKKNSCKSQGILKSVTEVKNISPKCSKIEGFNLKYEEQQSSEKHHIIDQFYNQQK